VFFSVNTQVMQAFWTFVAPPASPALVTVLDVNSAITGPNDPFPARQGRLCPGGGGDRRRPRVAAPRGLQARNADLPHHGRTVLLSRSPRLFSANSEGREHV